LKDEIPTSAFFFFSFYFFSFFYFIVLFRLDLLLSPAHPFAHAALVAAVVRRRGSKAIRQTFLAPLYCQRRRHNADCARWPTTHQRLVSSLCWTVQTPKNKAAGPKRKQSHRNELLPKSGENSNSTE